MLKRLPDLLFLILLWVPVLSFLELEWRYNEQYHYGYFVPLFTLYLIYLRYSDSPARTQPSTSRPIVFVLLLLTLIPLFLIRTSNPDWRPVYWVATSLAFAISLIHVARRQGWAVARHITPAFAMIFFSVPWLVSIENEIMKALMKVVAGVTVETVNLLGIYAVQIGNVIRLPNSIVGIEEACSGVRSLQSSLMAGYLFGELFRMHWYLRASLVLFGVILTFFLNLIRTLALTLITHGLGHEGYEKWHDPLGNTIFVLGFLGIALFAWLLDKFQKSNSTPDNSHKTLYAEELGVSPAIAYMGSGVILVAIIFNSLWFHKASNTTFFDYSDLDWSKYDAQVESSEIHPITTAQLKYSIGKRYDWAKPGNQFWTLFYFHWEKGKISSHAGVHRPENCLPASGLSYTRDWGELIWKTPEGYDLTFKVMQFDGFGSRFFVFFTVWDNGGKKPWYSLSWMDRIKDTLKRRTVDGRHSMQIIAEGVYLPEEAKSQALELLSSVYSDAG
jgi:exosortase